MSLPTNSNSFVSLGLVLTYLLSHYGSNFLVSYCMPGNFDWLSDILNFTLVSARYFCILIDLELCSGTQLFGNSLIT